MMEKSCSVEAATEEELSGRVYSFSAAGVPPGFLSLLPWAMEDTPPF